MSCPAMLAQYRLTCPRLEPLIAAHVLTNGEIHCGDCWAAVAIEVGASEDELPADARAVQADFPGRLEAVATVHVLTNGEIHCRECWGAVAIQAGAAQEELPADARAVQADFPGRLDAVATVHVPCNSEIPGIQRLAATSIHVGACQDHMPVNLCVLRRRIGPAWQPRKLKVRVVASDSSIPFSI